MAGVLFVACIPTKEHERELNPTLNKEHKSSGKQRNVTILQDEEAEQVSLLADTIDSPESEDTFSLQGQDQCSLVTEKNKVVISPKKVSLDNTKESSPHTKSDDVDKKEKRKQSRLEILPDTSMEEITMRLLKSLRIENYSWVTARNEKFIYVIFSVAEGQPCEEALHVFTKWGIGNRFKSTLGIIPCALYYMSEDLQESDEEDNHSKKDSRKSGWNDFVLSVVRSRLAVAQVVESVKGSAKLNFDFVSMIILAGTIAAVGLVENSTVAIVASMLISPLMGPILAGTFGTVIHDRKLQLMGVRNELVGLSLTILVGYIIGLIIGSVDGYYGGDQWPTQEMMSRGLLRSLWVGILIALPSGAGIALGLLGDNSGSLIGVAISASLLPPAVNAGLLWALATVEVVTGGVKTEEQLKILADRIYSNHLPSEYALLGCVSLSLTLVNIFCIFLAGIVVLKIKEVAPKATTEEIQQFWHHDIKVARDYNRSFGKEDAKQFEKQLAKELVAVYSGEDEATAPISPNDEMNEFRRRLSSLYHYSPDTARRISVCPRRLSQATWSPSPSTLENSRRFSLRDLEKLYASLGGTEHPRLSLGTAIKVAQLRPVRSVKSDEVSGLSPIVETNGDVDVTVSEGRRPSFFPRRNTRSRFTVIPSASDPLSNKC
ncbi:hypothetical protein RUM44_006559 [Polyplax serrata]|uniref:Uncharacterized protein n=1 Tax=Polyplax serrata TaxID=468196 RepID=A0ABR1AIG2_POLSC